MMTTTGERGHTKGCAAGKGREEEEDGDWEKDPHACTYINFKIVFNHTVSGYFTAVCIFII